MFQAKMLLMAAIALIVAVLFRRPKPAMVVAGGGPRPGGRGLLDLFTLFNTGGTGAESYNVQDSQLSASLTLPNAASTTVTQATGFDTGETTALAVQPGNMELLLTAPALTTTMLPDTRTMSYDIIAADNAALSTNLTVLSTGIIVQTGAGGAGAAGTTARYRLPSVCQRYVGFRIRSGASTTDSSTLSATLAMVF